MSDAGNDFVLEPFDRIFIRRSPGYEKQITATIEGEVLFPGEYSLSNKEERISDLIKRTGGLTKDAYPKGASLIRQFEINENERTRALKSSDLFNQQFLSSMNNAGNTFQNNINNPGMNGISDDKKRLILDSILISATQNYKEQAIGIDMERILTNPHSKYDLILHEGDRLFIPRLLETVTLSGSLLHPISARYDKKKNFKDYIRDAGGFSSDAKRSKSYIIYANGSADITRSFIGIKNYPKIEPGAEIVVPQSKKIPVKGGELVALGSALTSMALLVVTLLNTLR